MLFRVSDHTLGKFKATSTIKAFEWTTILQRNGTNLILCRCVIGA